MTRKYNYQGKQLTAKELAKLSGIGYDTMLNRFRQG